MLSLIELQNKKVEAKRKKFYDKQEMDEYLDVVYDNYKQLLEENKKLEDEKRELNKKIKTLSDGVQYYRSIETTLQKALILAEKTSKETKDAAILKAEAIEKDAHKRADDIINSAEGEYNKIKDKCIRLVQQFNQYKLQLKQAASAQLQLVEGDEFDISNPDEFAQNIDETVSEEKTTTVEPEKKEEPVAEKKEESTLDAATEEILNADTIDLRSTLDAVKTETEEPEPAVISEPAPASVQVQKEPEILEPKKEEAEPLKTAEVKQASVVEPVKAKTIEPMDIIFEDESASSEEKREDVLEPKVPEKNNESVPTLDSLLQDLNINNKNNQKSDDPFEFLGSVDDF